MSDGVYRPTPIQRQVLNATEARVLVVGGPGAGKTATALAKARLVINANPTKRVLFLTFSRAAVTELAGRLHGALGDAAGNVDIQTYHGFAMTALNSFGRYAGFGAEPVEILTRAEEALGLGSAAGVRYDDLVRRTIELLTDGHWIRERFLNRYAAVICDEYQDTGEDQSQLLELLASRAQLICFADPRQLIYEWLGSDRKLRLARFRETQPREIKLGDASHRDPSTLMTRLAVAMANQSIDDPVFEEAQASGRLRVSPPSDDVYADAIEEVKRLRRGGAETVGVFLMKRQMVDEFAERLTTAGIRHEIAGLQDSAGEAELAIGTLARFATSSATWRAVLERLAVFLYDSRRGRDNLPQLLVGNPDALPERPRRRLAALQATMAEFSDRPVDEFLSVARAAWSGLLLGGSPTLWEMGADDLRGQSIDIRAKLLSAGGADALYQIAAARRTGAVAQMIAGQIMPVRLMTRPQAKGREMDAVVIVNHPDDFEKDDSLANDRRVLFVMVTRARQSVSLVLRPNPTSLLAPFARFARAGA